MNRVLVIGSGGAGKSTFAARLAGLTGLPLVHLDAHYWRPGWVPTPAGAWEATVAELVGRERWVMDGNYGGTLPLRLEACDTVVWLDLPRRICLGRLLRRQLRYLGRVRPNGPAGCRERLSLPFLHWVWTYPRRRRPGIRRLLDGLPPEKAVHVLRSPVEVEAFFSATPWTGGGRDGPSTPTRSSAPPLPHPS